MKKNYDFAVLGVGAMGSSTAYALAQRGYSVIGIEQFGIAHNKGSSHGETRLIRKSYFEHPDYVPLLEKSYSLWRSLESKTGQNLFEQTGLVIWGSPSSKILEGVQNSSRIWNIPIEHWRECEGAPFKIPVGFEGWYEPTGGYLKVEKCIETYIDAAKKLGADFLFDTEAISWKETGSSVRVETTQGEVVAGSLVITAGPWSKGILKELKMPVSVHRVPLFWFDAPAEFSNIPCFAFDMPYGFFYGFPLLKRGFKVALHLPGAKVEDASVVDRTLGLADREPVERFLAETLPDFHFSVKEGAVCLYTLTEDEHFIVDRYPGSRKVAFAAGFSGHGFKFASVIGELLADLVESGKRSPEADFLRIRKGSHG